MSHIEQCEFELLSERCQTCPLQINAQREIDELTQNGNYGNAQFWREIAEINTEQCSAGEPTVEVVKRFKYFGRTILKISCATDRSHGILERYYHSIDEAYTPDS